MRYACFSVFSLFALVLLFVPPTHAKQQCNQGIITIERTNAHPTAFRVQYAITPTEKERGLMHTRFLPANQGMVFVYDTPQHVSFWMKNTLIPLDIIFIDQTNSISKIHHFARPHDTTPISSNNTIMVLEINGGLSRQKGIKVGAQTHLRALPCE